MTAFTAYSTCFSLTVFTSLKKTDHSFVNVRLFMPNSQPERLAWPCSSTDQVLQLRKHWQQTSAGRNKKNLVTLPGEIFRSYRDIPDERGL
ncbi:hypothetical protein BLNAU_22183 [Blattamonas nauphoetae]|uniref:Secreted protein n=1 Tax=Blattamonas nauphoetae TaxID=2049346 RepID=A0ABQ9WTR6_9EUKA|nr:hypothetical protein BLNAU_22183 [Blattamonas nauphoetae]